MENEDVQQNKNMQEEGKIDRKVKKYGFTGAFTILGLGIGILFYVLGYSLFIVRATLFIGMGIGMTIDSIIVLKSKGH